MERIFTYRITAENAGKDIHAFLREKGYSRHILASMKPIPDAVLVNGVHQYMRYVLQTGDILSAKVCDDASSANILPAPVPFTIVYEDQDLLVVSKPANEAIHPAAGHPANTLGNGVAWYYQQKGVPFVFRCINRLDRDTTGLLIVAKNLVSASVLEQQLVRREIHRTYLAIVDGKMPQEGVVDLPIARKEGSLIERCVDRERGDRAVTHFQMLQYYPAPGRTDFLFPEKTNVPGNRLLTGYSAVQLRLETGRTHQIRVHMAYLGHPLLGDTLYNTHYQRKPDDSLAAGTVKSAGEDPLSITRQALHSWKLDFAHPVTGEPMHFEAPVPEDMAALLES
ncbi:MAG: RluA family pseudouridine synthase [Bilifractor sp.]